ncbi:MAG: hypothetical protein R3F14_28705 [Polyangiaceae bacterium]
MRSSASFVLLAAGLALGGLGCTSESPSSASMFVVPGSLAELSEEHFFDHPWPSDLRKEGGKVRFEGYYNPKAVPIVGQYIESMKGVLDGFSPAAAGFLRFTGPVSPDSLPADPKASLDPLSSVQLIDVDPASPERGQRKLVSVMFRAEEGVYWLPNTLAVMPAPGFPLRPHTRYAIVVTDALRAADGSPMLADPVLEEVLGVQPATSATQSAHDLFAPVVDELLAAGLKRDNIVHFTSFTTSDPTEELFEVADDVKANVPAPTADLQSWSFAASKPTYDTYRGVYGPSPNYQVGNLPFSNYGDGGNFDVVNGVPQVVDTFDLRFSLSVPKASACPMPPEGYPIVLYAHGTGGDYESYVRNGAARELSQRCLAVMGVDQIFHGTRPGAPPEGSEGSVELLFFNVENPVASRTNPRQGAIDEVQRARLFTESQMTVPAGVSVTGQQIHFDGSKMLYFGHSQGGLSGPLFLASDASARGGVLSGASAIFGIALLEKTEPSPSVKSLVATVFLSLSADEASELSIFHPAISMAQTIVDVTDPIHYGRLLATEPRPGFASKSIYMTEGVNPDGVGDSYAPPRGIEAHSIAVGLPLQLPAQRALEQNAWGDPQPVTVPPEGITGNLGGGNASGVLAQWPISPGDDGHFVVFDDPDAFDQACEFEKSLAADPKGHVPAP